MLHLQALRAKAAGLRALGDEEAARFVELNDIGMLLEGKPRTERRRKEREGQQPNPKPYS
jgi:hypothetical protein